MKKIKNIILFVLLFGCLFLIPNSSKAFGNSELTSDEIKEMVNTGYKQIDNLGYNSSEVINFFIDSREENSIMYYRVFYFFDNSKIEFFEWDGTLDIRISNNIAFAFSSTTDISITLDNMNNAYGDPWSFAFVRDLKYSTFDVGGFSKNIDFFPLSPQGITKTLVEETEKAQIMEQMKKMIVGFLKYLIVLVISLIAFWKGWQFLSTQLRKA